MMYKISVYFNRRHKKIKRTFVIEPLITGFKLDSYKVFLHFTSIFGVIGKLRQAFFHNNPLHFCVKMPNLEHHNNKLIYMEKMISKMFFHQKKSRRAYYVVGFLASDFRRAVKHKKLRQNNLLPNSTSSTFASINRAIFIRETFMNPHIKLRNNMFRMM